MHKTEELTAPVPALQTPPNLSWSKAPPIAPGVYYLSCNETDYVAERVIVYDRADGILMAHDVHIGEVAVIDLHNGLTDVEWGYTPPVYIMLGSNSELF